MILDTGITRKIMDNGLMTIVQITREVIVQSLPPNELKLPRCVTKAEGARQNLRPTPHTYNETECYFHICLFCCCTFVDIAF